MKIYFQRNTTEMVEFQLDQILNAITSRNYIVVKDRYSSQWTVLMPSAEKYIYVGKFIRFCGVWVASKRWLRMAIKSAISTQLVDVT